MGMESEQEQFRDLERDESSRVLALATTEDGGRGTERRVREVEERLRSLTELSVHWYWEQDEELRFTLFLDSSKRKMPYPAEEMLGKRRWEIGFEPPGGGWDEHRRTLEAHLPFRDLQMVKRGPNGAIERVSSVSGEPIFDARGTFTGYRGVSYDITERHHTESALRESQERYRRLTQITSDWYWAQDENFRFVEPTEFRGRPDERPDGYLGRTRWELSGTNLTPPQWAAHRATLEAHQPFSDFEYSRASVDGVLRWVSVSGEPIFDDRGRLCGYRGVGKDITERKRSEERLEFLATRDTLTGLPNRALMADRAHQAISLARRTDERVAVLFLDLDNFKNVNDSLGHFVGDQILKSVAARLETQIRSSDTLSRFGGDEFVLLAEGLRSSENAAAVARNMLRALSEPFEIRGHVLSTGASIGISIFPDDGADFDTLWKNADAAMYQAKECGRNNYQFFSEALNLRVVDRLRLESDLRRALERREFKLQYQPIVLGRRQRVLGCEALVRWSHPAWGLLLPGRFVRVAEESGLIRGLGAWVLDEACRQIRAWTDLNLATVPVAVNVSAEQLADGSEFVDLVAEKLRIHRLAPSCLELEITESVLMRNIDSTSHVLRRLSAMGVGLKIDDFGTGYSSLAYLKRLPIHTLKIDREFVRDLESDPGDAQIVRAILLMARGLGKRVVAEGVENEGQMACLQRLHCKEFQGFLFGRPVDAEPFAQLFLKSRRRGAPLPPATDPSLRTAGLRTP